MARSCGCRFLAWLATVTQVGLAVGIIAVVTAKLEDVTYPADLSGWGKAIQAGGWPVEASCSLGASLTSGSLCTYAFVLAGLSLALSALISLIKCLTCDFCGCALILDTAFAVVGTLWWAVGASVVTKQVQDADSADLPLQQYRTAVVGMMWGEVGAFGALLLSGASSCCSRRCCIPGARFEKL